MLRPADGWRSSGTSSEPPPAVAEALGAALRRVLPDSPFSIGPAGAAVDLDGYRRMFARPPTASARRTGSASPSSGDSTWDASPTPATQWLDQLPTSGVLTRLPPERLAEVLDAVGEAIDALGGRFTVPYTTVAVTAAKAPTGRTARPRTAAPENVHGGPAPANRRGTAGESQPWRRIRTWGRCPRGRCS